jgi:hypothetical protein
LKISDANNDFLKIDGTAADSGELGGLTPDAFFQGSGNVVSGAVTASATAGQLLSLPGGIIVVSVLLLPGNNQVNLQIQNNTGVLLSAVQDRGSGVTQATLDPTTPRTITLQSPELTLQSPELTLQSPELTMQIFPNQPAFPDVVTLIVSSDGGASPMVVAQAFTDGV